MHTTIMTPPGFFHRVLYDDGVLEVLLVKLMNLSHVNFEYRLKPRLKIAGVNCFGILRLVKWEKLTVIQNSI